MNIKKALDNKILSLNYSSKRAEVVRKARVNGKSVQFCSVLELFVKLRRFLL